MFIVVAGPIGAGKSTVTRIYSQITGFEPLFETVIGHPYLEKFYENPREYAFRTQVFFLWDRFNKHYSSVTSGRDIVADRCIYEDAIFAKVLYQTGVMNSDDYNLTYVPHYKLLCKILPAPHLMIYLRASVDTLLYRIGKRDRSMEKSIQRDYMENLSSAYEEWIADYPHKKLIVETDDLDLTCDLHPDWFYFFKAIHTKVQNDDIPSEAIGLKKLKSMFPAVHRNSNLEWEKREIFCCH